MQVPAPFAYERATSVDHAISLLEQLGPDARVIAGGHSLLPMMKLRLARPEHLIDINDLVGELGAIAIDGDDLVIGAMARHADLLDVGGRRRALPGAARRRARDRRPGRAQPRHDRRVAVPGRSGRGSLGGAVGAPRRRRDPVGSAGTRTVPVRELHTGPYETVVGDAELLTEIRVPIRNGCGSAYEKLERRVGDWAIAAAAAVVWMEGDTIADAGIGLCAVGAEHFVAPRAEGHLRGQQATEDVIVAAAAIAAEDCNPTTDQRGPAEYKRHLAGELTARALRRAVARAKGQEA